MWNFLLHNVLYPVLGFMFEFIGDRPWLLVIIVVLIGILIWRFLWPVVAAFNTLFGWKGWATLGVALLTFGAFGAGWRAHRDSQYEPNQTADIYDPPRKTKPKSKPKTEADADDTKSVWYKVTHGLPLE